MFGTVIRKLTIFFSISYRLTKCKKRREKEFPRRKGLPNGKKAGILLNKIQELNIDADIQKEKNVSQVGGGSMPLEKLDTYTVTIKPNKFSVSYLEKRLRKSDAHIIGRINEDKYILDVDFFKS